MKFAYYPGCSLHGTAKEYGQSTAAVCRHLGIELHEIPDWNCCGASSAHATSKVLSLALPARNLAQAEQMGEDMLLPCAACYSRMAETKHELSHNDILRHKVNEIIEMDYDAKGDVLHLLQVVAGDEGMALVKDKVVKPLTGLKVAAYYGCLLVRPPEVTGFDDPENPQSMDRLLRLLGAEPVDWTHKVECCGASLSVGRSDIVTKLTGDILEAAKAAGAEVIAVACPMCQSNLDTRQTAAERRNAEKYDLPIVYITQLMGLAFGLDPALLSLNTHEVDPRARLRAKNIGA